MGFALNLVSEQTAVLLEKYFPNSKGKKNLARLFRCLAKCYKIMTSRCRHDSKDHMRSALGLELYYDVHILLSYFSTRITTYLFIKVLCKKKIPLANCKFYQMSPTQFPKALEIQKLLPKFTFLFNFLKAQYLHFSLHT